jgi:signal transduction histidine kinase
MPTPLQVLMLEDSENDALLLLRELRRGGFEVTARRVDNAKDLKAALKGRSWDIILSDYSMGPFDALAALHIVQEQGLDLPFIVISGTIGEDAGVAAIKAGASDYFAKGKYARLIPAIERGLQEAAERRRRKEAEISVKRYAEQLEILAAELEQRVQERTAALQASEAKLRAALAQEQELSALKTSFTSMVSHEFRTPLSVIQSSIDLLTHYADRMDSGRRLEKLHLITRQVTRLVKLLDDVLTFTRAESTGFAFKPASLDLVALCEEICEELKGSSQKEITIAFAHQGSCRRVWGDEFLLSHILQNLISNAIKYSHDGGTVRIMVACDRDRMTLCVEDQGIGIPKQGQDRLFEAFHRATNVGQIPGTGMGLAIVKRAVDAHGGTIACESVEGQGTRFTVTLPATGGSEEGESDEHDYSSDRG